MSAAKLLRYQEDSRSSLPFSLSFFFFLQSSGKAAFSLLMHGLSMSPIVFKYRECAGLEVRFKQETMTLNIALAEHR